MSAYRGRFAPSPTGPLHFGSLIAAVGSFLQARTQRGEWYVRIEDLDTPRVAAGAADAILKTLARLQMRWDGPVIYQSARNDAYRAALNALRVNGKIYVCACTRREIADSSIVGIDGAVYPGTCRAGLPLGRAPRAWRVDTRDARIRVRDAVFGDMTQDVEHEVGDFVVLRADGTFTYQLAVVVDDAAQGINEVVRGADLLDSTARQIYLQRLLALPTPRYLHLPVAVNARGEKLSKQTFAAAVDEEHPAATIAGALRLLNHTPPPELVHDLPALWRWAIANWKIEKLTPQRTIRISEGAH